jgi:type VI secretion system protein ImpM
VSESAGWYGKLPSAGDFASRRMPPEFVGPWDRWLQSGVAASRSALGERWQDLFLTFPIWRFVLPRGAFGPHAWCGVLLPSTDRVGRLFPLTLARCLEHEPALAASLLAIDDQLELLADVALHGLDNQPIEEFDARVSAVRVPPHVDTGRVVPLECFVEETSLGHWTLDGPLDALLRRSAERAALANLGRRALWWTPASQGGNGAMRLAQVPLAPELFTALISGH